MHSFCVKGISCRFPASFPETTMKMAAVVLLILTCQHDLYRKQWPQWRCPTDGQIFCLVLYYHCVQHPRFQSKTCKLLNIFANILGSQSGFGLPFLGHISLHLLSKSEKKQLNFYFLAIFFFFWHTLVQVEVVYF